MYAAGGSHPYRAACVWIMTEITEGRLDVVIDAETVQEILYRYGAIRRWDVGAALARSLLTLVAVVLPVDRGIVQRATELFARHGPEGIGARDLLHVAVMERYGIEQILSVDRHFDKIKGVKRTDPQVLFEERRPRPAG